MSSSFIKAKKQLHQVNTLVKQGKTLAAATSLYEAVNFVVRQSLLKHEKSDFVEAIEQAVFYFSESPELKKVYPLQIAYTEGEEKSLQGQLKEILDLLQGQLNESLAGIDLEDFKKQKLEAAQRLLDQGQYDEAKTAFDKLAGTLEEDAGLKEEIARKFFNAGRYKETIEYVEKASNQNEESAHLFNKFGMELRKRGEYAEAESFYLAALKIKRYDEYLLFNLGRVYLDWKRWDMVEKTAKQAINVNMHFEEARKMLAFAQKKLAAQK